jgi:hypothetical protein
LLYDKSNETAKDPFSQDKEKSVLVGGGILIDD